MAITFGFYTDAALTTPVTAALPFVQTLTPSAVDRVLWFGSRRADRICQATGGGAISLTPSGPGAGNVRLALSSAGLASATPGGALAMGGQVAGGVANAVAVHVRVLDTTGTAGSRAFSVATSNLDEIAA